MTLKLLSTFAAASALVATPVAASAAPASPAGNVASARAASTTSDGSDLAGGLGGGMLYAVLIVIGIAAIIAVGASSNDNPRSP